jgi:probable HAF family extracellular repeat protein
MPHTHQEKLMTPKVRATSPLAIVLAVTLTASAELAPYRLDLLGPEFYPLAMNDRGQVVGYTASRRGEGPALLWQDGVVSELGPGEAHDINDAGRIVIRPNSEVPSAVICEPDPTDVRTSHRPGARRRLPF